MYTWISRYLFLPSLLIMVGLFTGCTADPRLNGVWEGNKWEFGEKDERLTLILDADGGDANITFAVHYLGVTLSSKERGNYTTKTLTMPNRLLLNTENRSLRCCYRFSFPLFPKTLYLSINEEENGSYPENYTLDIKEGPVFVLRRQNAGASFKDVFLPYIKKLL